MASLLDAAETYLASTPLRRCVICHDGDDELREAVHTLRARGMSAAKIAAFLRRTAESYGHGLMPSAASIENHLQRHYTPEVPLAEKDKPRRRGR